MQVFRDLRALLQFGGFRKLLAVRLTSQFGDGAFQAGLAFLFFFSPQQRTTAAGAAMAIAALVLPFAIVAPFAGPLLDRWRRRQVLVWGNAARVVLAAAVALSYLLWGVNQWLYVLVLLTLGVNRLLLAGLSASLPKVVPTENLVIANSVAPTLGAVAATVGGAAGLFANLFAAPGSSTGQALVIGLAALCFAGAAALATRFTPEQLGPSGVPRSSLGTVLSQCLRDMVSGIRYLARRGTPAAGLIETSLSRFGYGLNLVLVLLMSRNLFAGPNDPEGLGAFGILGGLSLAGGGLAVILTPALAPRQLRPAVWVSCCLLIGALSQALLAIAPTWPLAIASAVLLGFAAQGGKIAVDAIVQADTADDFRGRAFSLYDLAYNLGMAAGAFAAAALLPSSGWSRWAGALVAVVYLLGALVYLQYNRRLQWRPRPVLTESSAK